MIHGPANFKTPGCSVCGAPPRVLVGVSGVCTPLVPGPRFCAEHVPPVPFHYVALVLLPIARAA